MPNIMQIAPDRSARWEAAIDPCARRSIRCSLTMRIVDGALREMGPRERA